MKKWKARNPGRNSGMNETDDVQLKAEIDDIMERVKRIMLDVDGLDAEKKETTTKTEE